VAEGKGAGAAQGGHVEGEGVGGIGGGGVAGCAGGEVELGTQAGQAELAPVSRGWAQQSFVQCSGPLWKDVQNTAFSSALCVHSVLNLLYSWSVILFTNQTLIFSPDCGQQVDRRL
jgi:hypothetical protein